MPFDLPPLAWLRAFEVAAKHLSFTDAGGELGLTQAAISKQIKSLELHLRQTLFVRYPRSLSLTKTGEAYLPKVRDAFERLSLGTREVFGNTLANELTIRCAVSFATAWLAQRLPEFLARHPSVAIRLISTVWNDDFDGSMADVDIQYGTGNWPGLQSHKLTRESLTPLCSPKLATQLSHPRALAEQRLIHVLGYKDGWSTWLKAAGQSTINTGDGLQVDTSLIAFEIAAQSGGVALARKSLVSHACHAGRLVVPFDLNVDIDEAFYLLQPIGRRTHPDAKVFIEWLLSQR
jgi:LysR family glycine cleavage system transcriptional activator